MTSIQPKLWVDRGAQAIAFYQAAFGVAMLCRVGGGKDIVAQLAIGDAAFRVATAGSVGQRVNPKAIGATGRTLLVADDPDAVFRHAIAAGAIASAQPGDEHRWRPPPQTVTAAGSQRMQTLPAGPCTPRSAGSAQRIRPP